MKKNIPAESHTDALINFIKNPQILFFIFMSFWIFLSGPSRYFIRMSEDPKEMILYAGGTFIILFSFIKKFNEKKLSEILPLNYFTLTGFFYFFYALVNPLITSFSTTEAYGQMGGQIIVFFLILVISQWKRQEILITIKIFTFIAFYMALFLYHQPPYKLMTAFGRIAYVSDLFLYMLPWSLYFLISEKNKFLKLLYFIISAVFIHQIANLSRRTALIGIIALAIYYISFYFKYNSSQKKSSSINKKKMIFILVSVIAVISSLAWHENSAKRLKSTYNTLTSDRLQKDPRIMGFKSSFNGFMDKPLFGQGYGSFRYVYAKYSLPNDFNTKEVFGYYKSKYWYLHPHNEVLFHLFEGGLIGSLLAGAFIFILFYYLIKVKRRSPYDPEIRVLLCALFIIFGLSYMLNLSSTHPYLRLVVILHLALSYQLIKEELPKFTFKPLPITLYQMAFLGLFSFLSFYGIYYKYSSVLIVQARTEAQMSSKSKSHIELATKMPRSYEALILSADIETSRRHKREALFYYAKAYQEFPSVPFLRELYILALYKFNKPEKAHSLLQQAVIDFPQSERFRKMSEFYNRKPSFP